MKIAALISRILLGLLFTVFGLNGFLHFIPMKAPTGLAGQYMGALFVSHYLVVVFLLQLIGGVLLLLNRFVPLALLLLGPVLCEYSAVSLIHGAGGLADSPVCNGALADCLCGSATVLCRSIRA